MASRLGSALRFAAIQVVGVACLLLAAEGVLRVALGMPRGLFAFALASERGTYPPSTAIPMLWGRIPYLVETNSLGLRGREIEPEKPAGTLRIAALGDSMTDGFFVDNPDTYPWILQDLLRERGHPVEVINAARGGGSIDKEFALLREVALPLDPDIALLTFVTNDLADIAGKPRPALIYATLPPGGSGWWEWLRVETAVGEAVGDLALRLRDPGYRLARAQRMALERPAGEQRYAIRGGRNRAENLKLFYRAFGDVDGAIAREPFAPEVEKQIGDYLWALEKLRDYSNEKGVALVFVYVPSYAQIYDETASLRMNRILEEACARLGVPFLDLTGAFRRQGIDAVLHLAPLDFHTNPAGNRVIAAELVDFLERSGLL